jgi:lipoprotein-anchoring transpeptidase ErfK/SrfK
MPLGTWLMRRIMRPTGGYAPCCGQMLLAELRPESRGRWGLVLRLCISPVVIAFALAGSIGSAAAQYYPPPPGAYPSPPPHAGAPVYRDANGLPYGPGAVQPVSDDVYPQPARPYFAPQPMPMLDGSAARPPVDVYGSSAPVPADVTGSVRTPAPPLPPSAQQSNPTVVAALPPEDQPEQGSANLPSQFRRQVVDFSTPELAGTVIIDTPNTYLYLVLGNGKALRYGIGVGREGFTWTGTERISRMKEWPDWFPPKEMIERQPYLPRFMAGGDTNPLGARAMYLGNTLYRIHGTNQPSTIGTFVSSGCIRLTNDDVSDLYSRVTVGTRVIVLPGNNPQAAAAPQTVPVSQVSERSPIPPAPIAR